MPENTWLAILLVIGLVVGVNLILWMMWRGGQGLNSQIIIVRQMGKAARKPWQKEDDALKELSERVENLKNSKDNKDGSE